MTRRARHIDPATFDAEKQAAEYEAAYHRSVVVYFDAVEGFINAIINNAENPNDMTKRLLHDAGGAMRRAVVAREDSAFNRSTFIVVQHSIQGLDIADILDQIKAVSEALPMLTNQIGDIQRILQGGHNHGT